MQFEEWMSLTALWEARESASTVGVRINAGLILGKRESEDVARNQNGLMSRLSAF